jgi:hypothetical protein
VRLPRCDICSELPEILCNVIDLLTAQTGVCNSSEDMTWSVPRMLYKSFPLGQLLDGVIPSHSCCHGTLRKRLALPARDIRTPLPFIISSSPAPHPFALHHSRLLFLLKNQSIYQFQWLVLRFPLPPLSLVSLLAPAPPPNPPRDVPSRSVRQSSRRLQGLRRGLLALR